MNKQKNFRTGGIALLLAVLLLPILTLPLSAEPLPGMDGIGGGAETNAPSPEQSAPLPFEDEAPLQPSDGARTGVETAPNSGTGARNGSVWGVLIAVGIAALAVAVIFLVMPAREAREEKDETAKRR